MAKSSTMSTARTPADLDKAYASATKTLSVLGLKMTLKKVPATIAPAMTKTKKPAEFKLTGDSDSVKVTVETEGVTSALGLLDLKVEKDAAKRAVIMKSLVECGLMSKADMDKELKAAAPGPDPKVLANLERQIAAETKRADDAAKMIKLYGAAATYDVAVKLPPVKADLEAWMKKAHTTENLEFLEAIGAKMAKDKVIDTFIKAGSPSELNLPAAMRAKIVAGHRGAGVGRVRDQGRHHGERPQGHAHREGRRAGEGGGGGEQETGGAGSDAEEAGRGLTGRRRAEAGHTADAAGTAGGPRPDRGTDGPGLLTSPAAMTAARVSEAETLLRAAGTLGRRGRFQLEAAIQAVHVDGRRGTRTGWAAILTLYDGLLLGQRRSVRGQRPGAAGAGRWVQPSGQFGHAGVERPRTTRGGDATATSTSRRGHAPDRPASGCARPRRRRPRPSHGSCRAGRACGRGRCCNSTGESNRKPVRPSSMLSP